MLCFCFADILATFKHNFWRRRCQWQGCQFYCCSRWAIPSQYDHQNILMDHSGYRLWENRIPVGIDIYCRNPWLLNMQQRMKTSLVQVQSSVTSYKLSTILIYESSIVMNRNLSRIWFRNRFKKIVALSTHEMFCQGWVVISVI